MSKQGVLLVNLGSPDSPSVPDVRRYLREFLMDGRVLDAPWPIRFAVVHFAILPSRPKQSAEAYHQVWTPEGSPLVVTSRKVQAALAARVPVPVELAMRYQNPSITSAVQRLAAQGVKRLLLIPLFPHFAMSSYETAVERVREVVARECPGMTIEVQPPYYDHPDYLDALVESAQPYLARGFDHLLFSFHGIPERHLRKSDPTRGHCLQVPNCCEVASPAHATCYRAQCLKTVAGFVQRTNLPKERYSIAFQSRLGRDPWLKPYTDQELERFGKAGVKRLLVICPAFVSDCLETLEEIGMRGRETFQHAGGGEYEQIPCLNDHPRWIAALEGMVKRFLSAAPATSAPPQSVMR
ncbi:MAG: ferrochelatase [Verrucomicrobia bacterium]|nr:ferrochelatase [Verrucomicrobiota bacterium]